VPRAPDVARAARLTGLPDAAFLLGAAGEYEQLALVPEAAVPTLRSAGWTPIGAFERAAAPGLSLRHADREVRLPTLPDPRDAESEEAYRDRLVSIAHLVPVDVPDPGPDPTVGRKERS
jgi:hypothetical protein